MHEAAAYLTRASAGVPHNDPRRAKLRAMEDRGQWYSAELKLLKNTHLFKYTIPDRWKDWVSHQIPYEEMVQRGLEAFQIVSGLARMRIGKALFTMPLTISLGIPVGVGLEGVVKKRKEEYTKRLENEQRVDNGRV